MHHRGWNAKYLEILDEFGYSRQQDAESAVILDGIIKKPMPVSRISKVVKGKTVLVIGSGPSLSRSIEMLKKHKDIPKIAADSTLEYLLECNIIPDIVMTDLDGNEESLKKASHSGAIMIVHAHGDNIGRLYLAEQFQDCIGTTQGKPIGRLENFGGFTDGDRGVFAAVALGVKQIVLCGMDFDGRIGKHSHTKPRDKRVKLKKLAKAKELLEWLAVQSNCKMYTTSGMIEGFEKVRYSDLDEVI